MGADCSRCAGAAEAWARGGYNRGMAERRPDPEVPRPEFETEPLTRPEYLSVMVHFYRAEAHRSTVWRQRLDATTNWAVLTSAGMMSFAFTSPLNSHFLLLVSNLVIFAYLVIEARRYRRYEVYRARVRMLEENFLLPIVSRQLWSPMEHWREEICADLDSPKYKSKLLPAIGFRLRRNYAFIFAIMLGAWLLKLEMHPTVARSFGELWARMAVGGVFPAEVVALLGLIFYATLFALMWLGRRHGIEPVDEVTGVEKHPERWKI